MSPNLSIALWPNGPFETYAILDCAADPAVFPWVRAAGLKDEDTCLFPGDPVPGLLQYAPHLLPLARDTGLSRWFAGAWGKHWGLGLVAPSGTGLLRLRAHLSRFTLVALPDGRGPAYFRYYDPRVLRRYAQEVAASELVRLFGPIEWFVVEGESMGDVAVIKRPVDDRQSAAAGSGRGATG